MRKSKKRTLCAALVTVFGLGLIAADADAGGKITGKATFEGTPPARRKMAMDADPVCVKLNPEGRLGEVMMINEAKEVQNVFVYIKDGLGDQEFETLSEPVQFGQVNCMFTPRVTGVMVRQTLEIGNSDPTLHNIHSMPRRSRPFNFAMPIPDQVIKKRFTSKEIMVRVKCDVHPWMAAYVGVLDHPFFAVSGADGKFAIENVPPGTYTVEAWHERLGTKEASLTVTEGGAATVDFSFALLPPKPEGG